jgi:hypothetical protein
VRPLLIRAHEARVPRHIGGKNGVSGYRFEANLLDLSLPPAEAARCAGFEMHSQS